MMFIGMDLAACVARASASVLIRAACNEAEAAQIASAIARRSGVVMLPLVKTIFCGRNRRGARG